MRLFFIILLFSCNSTQTSPEAVPIVKTNNHPKTNAPVDTLPNGQQLLDNRDSVMHMYFKEVVGTHTLKGGYITCYGIDDSMKYFYLRHGDTLQLLNKTNKFTSTWSLGVLEKDFDSFFVTMIDNGNGVPETYQVFDKKTGKNILGENVAAWSYKYAGNILYFLYDNEVDSIFLYNMKSGMHQGFKLPDKKSTDIIYYDLKKVTKNKLTISCTEHYSGKEKLVEYSRE